MSVLFAASHPTAPPDIAVHVGLPGLEVRLADLPSYRTWNAQDPDSLLRIMHDVLARYKVSGGPDQTRSLHADQPVR